MIEVPNQIKKLVASRKASRAAERPARSDGPVFRHIAAYYASAAVGGIAMATPALWGSKSTHASALIIGMMIGAFYGGIILPFWLVAMYWGRHVRRARLLLYVGYALVIGCVIGPMLQAIPPTTFWDPGDVFLHRLDTQLEHEPQSIRGSLAAALTYWLIAEGIRRKRRLPPTS